MHLKLVAGLAREFGAWWRSPPHFYSVATPTARRIRDEMKAAWCCPHSTCSTPSPPLSFSSHPTHSPSLRSGERPKGAVVFNSDMFPFGSQQSPTLAVNVCGNGGGYTSPFTGEVIQTVVRLTASDTSDQKDHSRGRDRQCGEPLNFCLSAQGSRQDRSDDRATLDGPKLSRLSSGLV
jgi:hypothetical protein